MLLVFYRARYLLRCLREIYFPTLRQVEENFDLGLSEKKIKRVLMIVHNDFFSAKGGVESYVLNLYNRIGKSKGNFDFYYLARVNRKDKKYGEIFEDKNQDFSEISALLYSLSIRYYGGNSRFCHSAIFRE